MKKRADPRQDLNLFIVFDAVMDEGSLSKAGKRLGLTQPAVSHALRRLRVMTGGERLFERTGRGVRPTARAHAIANNVRPALDALRSTLRHTGVPFDPKTSRQTFLLDFPFGIDAILVPELSARVRDCPNIEFRIAGGRARDMLRDLRYGETWLALDYEPMNAPDFHSELLYEDPLVLISRRNHPLLNKPLDLGDVKALPHVVVGRTEEEGKAATSLHLEKHGVLRRIMFSVPTIATLPFVVENQHYVATTTQKVARYFSRLCEIDIHPLPAVVPPLPTYMVWHRCFDSHEGHGWLRNMLNDICTAL
ncbi:putative HTH-type transcriptional regulator LeuO [Candidatus Filomicrobium marinum]|uniref:LysR family transcriptional regulator, transcriptional activator for leuABCD operon n=2 Tax=Filomicrobium TaxID=119044 RepID=A0A1H0IWC0_9HYPH|nr:MULTISPECIES: LysR family transcriptional regulator [Filomicrobium]CFX11840.1 putative HTH-type transcriptional regulator LeuO [Candidatus Filomicrobium marinum]CPR17342.1 putative HTH-type transcriptional regulator LeuO [Candidatus Filomicrobium marinum]SDO35633.1 LysR family transcriptional regulator, transcriptional activator for leuABCD operon [Filomicrobium insigne]